MMIAARSDLHLPTTVPTYFPTDALVSVHRPVQFPRHIQDLMRALRMCAILRTTDAFGGRWRLVDLQMLDHHNFVSTFRHPIQNL